MEYISFMMVGDTVILINDGALPQFGLNEMLPYFPKGTLFKIIRVDSRMIDVQKIDLPELDQFGYYRERFKVIPKMDNFYDKV